MEENAQAVETTETKSTAPVQDFWKNLAALLKVKIIVTLVVIGVFAVMALAGQLQSDTVMAIVTMVVAFQKGITCPHWTQNNLAPSCCTFCNNWGLFMRLFTTLRPQYDQVNNRKAQYVTSHNTKKAA